MISLTSLTSPREWNSSDFYSNSNPLKEGPETELEKDEKDILSLVATAEEKVFGSAIIGQSKNKLKTFSLQKSTSEQARFNLLLWFEKLTNMFVEDPKFGTRILLNNRELLVDEICQNFDKCRGWGSLSSKRAPDTKPILKLLLMTLQIAYNQKCMGDRALLDFLLPAKHTYNEVSIGSIIEDIFGTPMGEIYINLLNYILDNEDLQKETISRMYRLEYKEQPLREGNCTKSFLNRLKPLLYSARVNWKYHSCIEGVDQSNCLLSKLEICKSQDITHTVWRRLQLLLDTNRTSLSSVLSNWNDLKLKIQKQQDLSQESEVHIPSIFQIQEEIIDIKKKYHEEVIVCKQESLQGKKNILTIMEGELQRKQEEAKKPKIGASQLFLGAVVTMSHASIATTERRQAEYIKEEYRKEMDRLEDEYTRSMRTYCTESVNSESKIFFGSTCTSGSQDRKYQNMSEVRIRSEEEEPLENMYVQGTLETRLARLRGQFIDPRDRELEERLARLRTPSVPTYEELKDRLARLRES